VNSSLPRIDNKKKRHKVFGFFKDYVKAQAAFISSQALPEQGGDFRPDPKREAL
jgi:hypothetical protein